MIIQSTNGNKGFLCLTYGNFSDARYEYYPYLLFYNIKEANIKHYDYFNTLKAITKKIHMVIPQRSNLSFASAHVQSTDAGFENTICEYVDTLKVISRIKSVRKKSIIAYKAMGYCNWEIAEIMRLSESMIDKHLAQIKNILKKR